ncbi:MAG: hypothetical protein VX951_15050 [Planctomycetota bacterium]|nr:hypothetical protein [Planctomycetota bacterium]
MTAVQGPESGRTETKVAPGLKPWGAIENLGLRSEERFGLGLGRGREVAFVDWDGRAQESGFNGRSRSWRARHPKDLVKLSVGELDFKHREYDNLGGMTLDDEVLARVARFEFERLREITGAGVSVETISVNDSLHTNTAGITDSDTASVEVFPYLLVRPASGRFRAPVRFGPCIHVLQQETSGTAPDSIDYYSLILRVEAEPEFDLIRTDDLALSVFASGHVYSGMTTAEYDWGGGADDFETGVHGTGYSFGVRFSLARFHAQAAYVHSRRKFAESDEELVGGSLLTLNESEFIQEGLMFSLGVRW